MLHVHATASDESLVNATTQCGNIYWVVRQEIPFSALNGAIESGPNQNLMNDFGLHIETGDTKGTGTVFDLSKPCGTDGDVPNGRECIGLVPGVGNETVSIRGTSEGVIVSVGTVSSAACALPSGLPPGATIGGRGNDCCSDPCCAQ